MKVADIIPKVQLRGAETFAQHLEEALVPAFDCRLFTTERGTRKLREELTAFGPDLIVTHGGDPLRSVVKARLGRPIVYLKVSSVPAAARGGLRGRVLRRAYAEVAAFVAVSESLKAELVEAFDIPAERVDVIPNGRPRVALTDAERSALREELGSPGDGLLVIWVGSMVPEKDPDAAVRLASDLAAIAPNAHLAMIGDGPLLIATRNRTGGMANLSMLGGRPDAARYIAAADVLVSTSVTEGMPGVIIEALLAGVPVVAPAIGGIPEVVGDGGMLTSPGNPDEMAAQIAAIAGMGPEARRGLAAAAAAAGAPFEITQIAGRFADLYRRLA